MSLQLPLPVPVLPGGSSLISVEIVPDERDVREVIASKIKSNSGREDVDDPFYVADLGQVLDLYDLWKAALPDVRMFYAVKCNHDPVLLKILSALEVGFDCATKGEIQTILKFGVAPDRIVYAHPIKQISHLQYAAEMGVKLIVFDCEEELLKIMKYHPSAELILRVSSTTVVMNPVPMYSNDNLKVKFGVSVARGLTLLAKAKELGANVVGVSFLTGPGKAFLGAEGKDYKLPIESCDKLFEHAAQIGCKFSTLDIGGGFPESEQSFTKAVPEVSIYVAEFLEKHPGTEVIAEPGRYLAASVFTLATCVVSKKIAEGGSIHYCISDSTVGGSLSKAAYLPDYLCLPQPLKQSSSDLAVKASFWGRTCAPDYIGEFCTTDLEEGDWVIFENMGAYTLSMTSSFHSFLIPAVYYFVKETHSERLRQLLQSS